MEKLQLQMVLEKLKHALSWVISKVKSLPRWAQIVGAIVLIIVLFNMFRGGKQNIEYTTDFPGVRDVQTTISVVGSVVPDQEIDLSFELSGTVKNIYTMEGQEVSSGALLLHLNNDDIKQELEQKEAALELARAKLDKLIAGVTEEQKQLIDQNVQNAQKGFTQAQSSLSAIQAANAAEVRKAEVAYENAKKIYEDTKTSNESLNTVEVSAAEEAVTQAENALKATKDANRETVTQAQASLDQAKVALENAKLDQEVNAPVADNNLADAQEDAFYDAVTYLDEVDASIRAINDIITVEEYNKDANAAYRDLLGVKKNNSYDLALSAYYALKEEYNTYRDLFQITERHLSYSEIVSRLDTLKAMLDQAFHALSQTYIVLENTLTNLSYTTTSLNADRTNILAQREAVTSSLSGVANTVNSVESLQLQKTTNDTTFSNAVKTAQAALTKAETAYKQAVAQAELQETTAFNALETARDNLAKVIAGGSQKDLNTLNAYNNFVAAERALESVRKQAASQEKNAESSLVSAESELKRQERQQGIDLADPRSEDIRIEKANVRQAEVALELAKEKLKDSYLQAPMDGVVATINVETGESVNPGQIVVTVISKDKNIIEANISETEISEIKKEQEVLIDFDAFSIDDKYTGSITFIASNRTSLDGVIYYLVKVLFDPSEYEKNEIRPGMTGNLDIITHKEKNALAIPNQAVNQDSETGEYFVEVVDPNTREKKEKKVERRVVELGFEGDEYTVVTDGLTAADEIVLSSREINE